MSNPGSPRFAAWLVVLAVLGTALPAGAEGESDGTFPSWEERWLHQLINRARCDPQFEMDACGASCAEAACYSQAKPLTSTAELNRAARFHGANLTSSGCGMKHNSPCTLLTNIDDLYPDTCDGATSCACVSGTDNCSPTAGTSPWTRIGYFGTTGFGENIAGAYSDPTIPFYQWLFEPTGNSACGLHGNYDNGHRYNILIELSYVNSVGLGISGSFTTADFGAGPTAGKIPSGSHHPRQASAVELWANWYDAAGPSAATVNVEGVCHSMTLDRGSSGNGAWMVEVDGVGSGCHRYYFEFHDSVGTPVTYPTTGSLAIGTGESCPDWQSIRPAPCLGSGTPIFEDGFENGSTSLWSDTVPSP